MKTARFLLTSLLALAVAVLPVVVPAQAASLYPHADTTITVFRTSTANYSNIKIEMRGEGGPIYDVQIVLNSSPGNLIYDDGTLWRVDGKFDIVSNGNILFYGYMDPLDELNSTDCPSTCTLYDYVSSSYCLASDCSTGRTPGSSDNMLCTRSSVSGGYKWTCTN